jgi:acyl-CoA synthetase (AMP-forming)/AMP-acid ligase II
MRLHDHLEYLTAAEPDAEFAATATGSISRADAMLEVNRVAASLVASGLEPGDRVAILSRNSWEYPMLYFAASKAGLVSVPLNVRLVPREWEYIVNDADARLVVVDPDFVPGVDSIRDQLRGVRQFVSTSGRDVGWDDLQSFEPVGIAARAQLGGGDGDVYLMYTSGTTGRPKGVVMTHEALLVTLMQWRLALPLHPGERALVVAPMHHASGALTSFHAVASGASVFVMQQFDVAEVGRVLSEERIGFVMLVPAMIRALLEDEEVCSRSYSDLRTVFYGASAISPSTLRRAIEVFGCAFVQSFGMTEMPNLVYLTAADHRRALDDRPDLLLAAGRPGPGSSLKIVDDDDREVPSGTIGEICGRGGQMMDRYWQLPEATAEALRDGWMHTGDAGYVDDEGYLFIKDRIKDMVCTGGENVYPREVEDALAAHPAIADVAVIGVPDERWGERVHAIIVLRRGHELGEADLAAFSRDRLADFKRPRSVSFVDELPRNAGGKLLKAELRKSYWADSGREIG